MSETYDRMNAAHPDLLNAPPDWQWVYDHPFPPNWSGITEVPPPQHNWADVMVCPGCGRAFMIKDKKGNK